MKVFSSGLLASVIVIEALESVLLNNGGPSLSLNWSSVFYKALTFPPATSCVARLFHLFIVPALKKKKLFPFVVLQRGFSG